MPPQTITKASNVPIETSSPSSPIGKNPATAAATVPVRIVVTYGRPELRMHFAEHRRQQAVARHGEEDPRLPHEHHQHD